MSVRLIAFTARGLQLAQKLAKELNGTAERCGGQTTLAEWTADAFSHAKEIVFVGAAGIAVRAIAPHIKSKAADPAVVVVDEKANFAIPVLSGHLGGANALARKIAGLCGAVPVITTATDINGVFAVDEWAKKQRCRVINPEKIKAVSGRLLAGDTVNVKSVWPVAGTPPQGVALTEGVCDVSVNFKKDKDDGSPLFLVPPVAVLGIGCRKGTTREKIEKALETVLEKNGIFKEAISLVCSIDLKKDEAGLVEFCMAHHLNFRTFSAEELNNVKGSFTASDFVKSVTGVDNVCERSAILGYEGDGMLCVRKYAADGVTMAIALKPFALDWSF